MMIKKTSIDRKAIYDLFQNIDATFTQALLSTSFPFMHGIPDQQQIDNILNRVDADQVSNKGIWTDTQDQYLKIIVLGTCLKTKTRPLDLSTLQWDQISRIFKFHNWKACRNRWLNEKHKKVNWTPQEDQALMQLQSLHPNKWCEIAIELMKICQTPYVRLGKQCRDRWVNKLDPKILNIPWYKEEELRLFQEVKKRGKRWADISAQVFKFRRTENTIKNRFYNLLKQEENRQRLGRVPKDERDILLIDSVIETLKRDLNKCDKSTSQNELNIDNKNFEVLEFDSQELKELVIIKQKKIQKLNNP
ncbi:unnamed protein product (macronuclear) [Paramecium tetraurelia]|uniref:Myb-like DNA-binding domain containing protein n=1 Tax=Paramecium tetraurelia TaxID=5888 RepID=A0CPP2_PARTE|nr:uncharacterized protein GSPATT00009151001 [Paramecium tetraurelia]CAK72759.1 unnamed protein product [Paramecium tetraurelia]|eukprot:XP_001440156.1 hypothetical protein (macronuclear) [Paramecium tetraurelia strain d4-2]